MLSRGCSRLLVMARLPPVGMAARRPLVTVQDQVRRPLVTGQDQARRPLVTNQDQASSQQPDHGEGGAGVGGGEDEPLYPGHIPTSLLQRLILAGGSAVVALADPWRADMVAVNGEVTGSQALRYMLERMEATEEGRSVLASRPRITGQTLNSLAALGPTTVGGTYWTFMKRYGLDPDSRAAVQFVDDPLLAFVMTRYRETHDLTHAVLGMPTTMLGEVLVKWVEGLQTRLPMCVGGAIFGPIRFKTKQRERYRELLPWAIRVGTEASFLPGVHYEARWEQDITDFRREMNIAEPPVVS